jgi:hypothetical protein
MHGSVRDERELTGSERALIEWLIQNGTGDSAELLGQLAQARVVSRCGCGCPTIDLAIGTRTGSTRGASAVVADAVGQSPECYAVGVVLHVREGFLSELEVYPYENVGPFATPSPDSLKIA